MHMIVHAQRQVLLCKGITAHARPKKEAYQPRNTKIHSSRRIAFFAEKRHHANLRYADNQSIPFASIREVTLTHFGPTCT